MFVCLSVHNKNFHGEKIVAKQIQSKLCKAQSRKVGFLQLELWGGAQLNLKNVYANQSKTLLYMTKIYALSPSTEIVTFRANFHKF